MRRLLYMALLIPLSVIHASSQTLTDSDKGQFIKDSVSTIDNAKPGSRQVSTIRTKEDKWEKTQSDRDWVDVTDTVYMAAKSENVRSVVSITSTRGGGATVKYQTLGQWNRHESPMTAKTPTEAMESMYLGVYHIWSERNGVATSDKNNQFEISDKQEKVTLSEQ